MSSIFLSVFLPLLYRRQPYKKIKERQVAIMSRKKVLGLLGIAACAGAVFIFAREAVRRRNICMCEDPSSGDPEDPDMEDFDGMGLDAESEGDIVVEPGTDEGQE